MFFQFLIMMIIFIQEINTLNQIFITFNSNGTHLLFCDDIIKYFGTSNISIYKILEDQKKNISQELIKKESYDGICKNGIYYSTNSKNDKILIEFQKFPKNSHNLFRNSTINSIEIIKDFQLDDINEISDFSNMFQDCTQLTSIDLSNFNFCNVGLFNNMFSGCKNLEFFILPKNIPINCINIEDADFSEMFSNCSSLTSIDLSDIIFNGKDDIDDKFTNCDNIESLKLEGNLNLQKDPQSLCFEYNNISFCFNNKDIFIEIFTKDNELRNLNLFELNINLSYLNLDNLNSLEECLYYEYYSNIKNCSKYMGFHHCGECINTNTEYYCTKNIDEEDFNFYYLEEQKYRSYKERECYWSHDFNNFLSYNFINNSEKGISYYLKNESCELFLDGTSNCIKCNNNNGYYKIENESYLCANERPADNYFLDNEAKEWHKCNERCRQCSMKSRLENDYQCLNCSQSYYPYQIDYINFQNGKITGFNCYTEDEVKSKYSNYFINSDNQFEKCDISCLECSEKNKCIKCNYNYYYIFENENKKCYHEPLEKYRLITINSQVYFKQCFHLCKYCNMITQSCLYQQCTECDFNFTLDKYTLNQSFCIPEDISNSSFIKDKTKWYLNNMKELEIGNKGLIIDYERLLNDIKYNNMSFVIVNKCPDDKPYIIYSIRQCVSSCNSSNLIEKGIFMTKKLYLYNGICYDECPYGSIKDDINNICIEVKYNTSVENYLNVNLFKENNDKYILKYLSEYANNLIDIIRGHDFSNYFYTQTINESLIFDLKMPKFNFSECIKQMQYKYNLFNNSIFVQIIEFSEQKNKNGKYNINSNLVNSTEYKFFLENGTILNHLICEGKNILTEKRVEMNKIDIEEIKDIESKYKVSIFDTNNEIFNDYCIPFNLGKKDLTLYDRKLLLNKYKPPCDEGCNFLSFDKETNYSTCICPIKFNKEKSIIDLIKEEVVENDYIKLLNNGNLKYFKCYKAIIKIKPTIGFIILIAISLCFAIIHCILFFISCKNSKNIKIDKEVQKQNTKNNINQNLTQNQKETIILEINKLNNKRKLNKILGPQTINSKDELANSFKNMDKKENEKKGENEEDEKEQKQNEKDIKEEKDKKKLNEKEKEKRVEKKEESIGEIDENNNYSKDPEFISLLLKYKEESFYFIFCDNLKEGVKEILKIRKEIIENNLFKYIILLVISIHSFFFINGILYSDEYISMRNSNEKIKLEYIITREYKRLIYSFLISLIIIRVLSFLLESKEYLKILNKYKINFTKFIIILLHFCYFYFFIIFGTINQHIIFPLLISTLISLAFYIAFFCIICFIIFILRIFSFKCESEFLFNISNCFKLLFD